MIILSLIIEILILWVIFQFYLEFLVRRKGPIGGIQFYPKAVQERALELGLISRKILKNQKLWSIILLVLIDLIVPFIMIVIVNHAKTFWEMTWQYYVLFAGQELYDWIVIDVWWVTLTDWWIIPGIEDLNHTWHDPKIKFINKIKVFPFATILAVVTGGIYYLIMMPFN